MPNYARCKLCERGGTISDSPEVRRVPSNVRRFCKEEFTLWRCGNCKSVHCLEDVNLARYYEGYPLNSLELSPPIRMVYRNRLRQLQQAGLKPAHHILDYGCGGGLFIDFLRSRGFLNAVGYDSFVPRYAGAEPLRASYYDGIVSYDVIEHVEDPVAYMKELTALSRPDGILAIGTPRAEGIALERTRDMVLHPPYHRHILSERVLLKLGSDNGLTAERVYRRSLVDSLVPTLNSRFITGYIEASGGQFDAVMERSQLFLVISSPKLWFWGLFGYFLPRGENMVVTFRKGGPTQARL